MIKFFITGEPVAQGRPRFTSKDRNGDPLPFVRTYDPAKSKNWKETIAWEAKSRGFTSLEGPLRMVLTFRLRKPKSVKRKWPTVKPDLSNMEKGIEDALNKICYKDDSQIVIKESKKEYAKEGFEPGVLVMIEEIK